MAAAVTSPVTSSEPNSFTEEQIAFLVFHSNLPWTFERVCENFNEYFSTQHERSLLRKKTVSGRRSEDHWLDIAENQNYEWYEPELRKDKSQAETRQRVRQKKERVVKPKQAEPKFDEEHRAFMATKFAYTDKISDISDSLWNQFHINFGKTRVGKYLNGYFRHNKAEMERLKSVASGYSWYRSPSLMMVIKEKELEDKRDKQIRLQKDQSSKKKEVEEQYLRLSQATREDENTNIASEAISGGTIVIDESQDVEMDPVPSSPAPEDTQAQTANSISDNDQLGEIDQGGDNDQTPYNIEAAFQTQAPDINNQPPSDIHHQLDPTRRLPTFVMTPSSPQMHLMPDVEVTSASQKKHKRNDSDESMELSPMPIRSKLYRRNPPPPGLDLSPRSFNDEGPRVNLEERFKLVQENSANEVGWVGGVNQRPADYPNPTGGVPYILTPGASAPTFGSYRMPDGSIFCAPHNEGMGYQSPYAPIGSPYLPGTPEIGETEPGQYRSRPNYQVPLTPPIMSHPPQPRFLPNDSSPYGFPGSFAETATPSTTPTPNQATFFARDGSGRPTQFIFENNPYELKPKKTTTAHSPLPVAPSSTATARPLDRQRDHDRTNPRYKSSEEVDKEFQEALRAWGEK